MNILSPKRFPIVLFFVLLVLLTTAVPSSAVNTGWIQKGLDGTYVSSLLIDPSNPQIIYAAGDRHGVLKSTDAGDTWTEINNGLSRDWLSDIWVFTLIIDPTSPQRLYAALGSGLTSGVFKSTDGGETWASIGFSGIDVYLIVIDPVTPQTIYAATYYSGIFKSTDGGNTWRAHNAGLPKGNYGYDEYKMISALAINPATPEAVYAGTDAGAPNANGGIYKSIDGGNTWSLIGLRDYSITNLMIPPQAPQTVFAAAYNQSGGSLFVSTDGGSTWNPTSLSGPLINDLRIDSQSHTLYAGTQSFFGDRAIGGGVYKSADGGSTWQSMGLTNCDLWTLALSPASPRQIYAGGLEGVSAYVPVLNLPVAAGGGGSVSTTPGNLSVQEGYAEIEPSPGSVPYAAGVVRFVQNGVTVNETGIPATAPTTRARIFIDYRSGAKAVPGRPDAGKVDIDTGIAIVNYSTVMANLTFILRDMNGMLLANGHGTMGPRAHIAKFIEQIKDVAPDFASPADFPLSVEFGSLEISCDQPFSILALRMVTNQRKETFFTTTPIADLTQTPGSGPLYFPQLADGGGYTTSLVLLNTSAEIETGSFQVFDDSGAPLVIDQAGGERNSSFRYLIPPGGAFRFQSDGVGPDIQVGWIRLTPDASALTPVGSGLFSYNPQNVMITESGMPASVASTHARIYVDTTGKHYTGVAIANTLTEQSGVILKAFASDGITPASSFINMVMIPGSGHVARFADQFVPNLPRGFKGVLDISSSTPFAAFTIRALLNERDEFLMTTLPVADSNTAAPTPIVLPQIADGGGFTTQFILLNPPGHTTATFNFFGNDGAVMELGN
jgi:photosystem II stability/assembly factor-like uncharacterized protein